MAGPSKLHKLLVRVGAALAMLAVLLGTVFGAGQRGVAVMIVVVTCGLFREMVNVAHREGNQDREMPWFRSILYAWFTVAIFTAYTLPSLQVY
jgi:4-hydroxybenzoate polyprenyltransferase